ncbi:MAG: hypothetical protein K1X48_03085 [Burkholderiaceae bacterium]|nr:hypothetical protein [Burkholderiaceae bacterium]
MQKTRVVFLEIVDFLAYYCALFLSLFGVFFLAIALYAEHLFILNFLQNFAIILACAALFFIITAYFIEFKIPFYFKKTSFQQNMALSFVQVLSSLFLLTLFYINSDYSAPSDLFPTFTLLNIFVLIGIFVFWLVTGILMKLYIQKNYPADIKNIFGLYTEK